MMNVFGSFRGHVARSSALNLLGAAIPAFVAIALLPLITRGLGIARFGVLGLTLALLEYANLFALGMGPATTKYVAQSLARRDRETAGLVAVSVLGQLALAAVGGAGVAIAASWLATTVFDIPPALHGEATDVFRLVGLLIPVTLLFATLLGIVEGAGQFGRSNAVRTPVSVLTFVVPAIGAAYDASLAAIVIWLVLARLAGCVFAAGIVRGILRGQPWDVRQGWLRLRQLLSFGVWLTVSNVLNPVLVYGERFLLGVIRGVSAVGLYAAPLDALLRALLVPGSLGRVLLPTVSAAHSAGGLQESRRLFARSVKAISLILGVPLAIVVLAAPWLLHVWLGPEFARGAGTAARILAAGVFVNALALIPTNYLLAIGRPDVSAKLHLGEVVGYLPLAAWLIWRYGVTGAALAWSLRVAVDSALLFVATRRVLAGQPAAPWRRSTAGYAATRE